jgi:hypothetical protein
MFFNVSNKDDIYYVISSLFIQSSGLIPYSIFKEKSIVSPTLYSKFSKADVSSLNLVYKSFL